MIRTLLVLRIAAGMADELVHEFRRLGILDLSGHQEGCLGTEIDISSDQTRAIVTALWEDEVAYSAWTTRPDRADMSTAISRFLDQEIEAQTVGEIFRVAHRVSVADERNR